MNYQHAFHAGNHADVLKHVALLALCDALLAKPAPVFALDTHAGAGLYHLHADAAQRTGEASGGIGRLQRGLHPAIDRYLDAVADCRAMHGADAYPGSPWLLAHALRAQDRIACCELQPGPLDTLKATLGGDARVAIHGRDGYGAMKALLPPKPGGAAFNRGLVLVDPPYEAQLAEFDAAFAALRDGLQRWPQGMFALWYPVKTRRALARMQRSAAAMPAKSLLQVELLVRADDSPLRMNGSGLLVWNAPWRFDDTMRQATKALVQPLADGPGGGSIVQWLRAPP